jgi:hypothetical protein
VCVCVSYFPNSLIATIREVRDDILPNRPEIKADPIPSSPPEGFFKGTELVDKEGYLYL